MCVTTPWAASAATCGQLGMTHTHTHPHTHTHNCTLHSVCRAIMDCIISCNVWPTGYERETDVYRETHTHIHSSMSVTVLHGPLSLSLSHSLSLSLSLSASAV